MANIRTHIICYDDHRGFAEDVKRRFTDSSRYQVHSFQTREEVLSSFEKEKENKFCKIAILGLHETSDQYHIIEQLIEDIRIIDNNTGIILLGPPEKIEVIKKTLKTNIEAYIPKNSNMILRIHNSVKKLISEHSIGVFRKRRNYSFYALLAFLLVSLLVILISYIRLPQYF